MVDRHADAMPMATDYVAAQDCAGCSADADCNGYDCSSCHCVSSVLALLPLFSFPTNPGATGAFSRMDHGVIDQLSSYLFRPPKG